MDKKAKRDVDGAQEDGGWQYKPSGGAPKSPAESADNVDSSTHKSGGGADSVEWTASEFIAHEKGFWWYAILVVATAAVATGIYFATRDVFSVAVVLIMATIFGVAGSHKPRVVAYKLDSSGLTAGTKFYSYHEYKSFSLPDDGPLTSITLTPMKRLDFPVGAYLAPDSQQQALEVLSSHLPLERHELTTFDHIMRELRF